MTRHSVPRHDTDTLHVFKTPWTFWHYIALKNDNDNPMPWSKRLTSLGLGCALVITVLVISYYLDV